MEIRQIRAEEVAEVESLAHSFIVRPREDKPFGFYDYTLSREQYMLRARSPFFLVARDEKELEGFCMAYDSEFVRRLIEQETRLREEVIFGYLNQCQDNYVYLDQFAVRKPGTFGGSITACSLLETLRQLSLGRKFIQGVIPHKPWRNQNSIRFFTHRGGEFVQEIGDKNKIVFGVYRLDLI